MSNTPSCPLFEPDPVGAPPGHPAVSTKGVWWSQQCAQHDHAAIGWRWEKSCSVAMACTCEPYTRRAFLSSADAMFRHCTLLTAPWHLLDSPPRSLYSVSRSSIACHLVYCAKPGLPRGLFVPAQLAHLLLEQLVEARDGQRLLPVHNCAVPQPLPHLQRTHDPSVIYMHAMSPLYPCIRLLCSYAPGISWRTHHWLS